MSDADEIPGLGPKTARPRLDPAADIARHVRSPEEYFVLSRVDGHTSYEELCRVSGLTPATTLVLLRRFKDAGIIVAPGATPARGGAAPPRATPTGPTGVAEEPVSPLVRLDDGSPVDPAALDAGPDLPRETKARILRLHRRARALGPEELLGIAPGASLGTIKRAYFAASKELHPDRFYGKDLGLYRGLLAELFAALTDALERLERDRRKG